jgi:hypothetical protein
LLLKHRRDEARRLRTSARMVASHEAVDGRASAAALDARVLFPRVADAIESLPDDECSGAEKPGPWPGSLICPPPSRAAWSHPACPCTRARFLSRSSHF